MKSKILLAALLLFAGATSARTLVAADNATSAPSAPSAVAPDNALRTVGRVSDGMEQRLKDSVAEYNAFCEEVRNEKIPLSSKISRAEDNLTQARQDYDAATRKRDETTLGVKGLNDEIKRLKDEDDYVLGLLTGYAANFKSQLYIAENDRYKKPVDASENAVANGGLSPEEKLKAQIALMDVSIDRLDGLLGGVRFEGDAVNDANQVKSGTFLLVGPTAVFRSADGKDVGVTGSRVGSPNPAVISFWDPANAQAVDRLVTTGAGLYVLDPTRGNAHKVETTHETLQEHVKKGGPIMFPIIALGFASIGVALFKWLQLSFIRRPSDRQIAALMAAVARQDHDDALAKAKAMKGPVGAMLRTGVEHLKESRDLVEEVMYESVLTARHKLQGLLPFIATSATCAPLLGLLGTVSGIISTFKVMTVFGSGDAKTLSGGISEALIGTEFGLYVAIPSLLLHAFLSRKARGTLDQMEKTAVAFVNQLGKTPQDRGVAAPESTAPSGPGTRRDEDLGTTGAPDPVPTG